MKRNMMFFIMVFFIIGFGFSQQKNIVENQNPNYKLSINKYVKRIDKYNLQQGTTLQKIYKAIDPLEQKRELRALKRKYRANRLLWRHQERMERAKYGNYYDRYNYSIFDYNNNWNWFNNNQSLFNLGLLGSYFLFK